jgi:uroporphyrin-III C-methyltransferase / precorrin-2 dehydrogenase / sirohydrochlorin ferrochelatase
MRYLPLFLDLRDRRVLLVGGGAIAERKFALLAAAQARVRIVAPALGKTLALAAARGAVEHVARAFTAEDLDGAWLAVAATGDPSTNRAVAEAAAARRILVNVVDELALSSAIVPAIVDRSPLVVAVSSAGVAPELARLVRRRIEASLDSSLGRMAALCERWRARIRSAVSDLGARRRLYDWLLNGPPAALVRAARAPAAERLLEAALRRGPPPSAGSVVLVGAGPGDPGLLTLNALRALQSADVVLHDRLVSREILELARRDAELIEVGKGGAGHGVSQTRIHELLVEHSARGRRVVRLKGGDPFVFGRGGEELEYLVRQGIAFEVVPGVTAALACAAYAGIPLTHREHSSSVRFVTAHCRESLEATDWRGLAGGRETLAVYMGVAMLTTLRAELLAHGRPASTPIAFIENGSRAEQRVIVGTLQQATELAAQHALASPTLLVIGEVAALARTLHWFGAEPLELRRGAERSAA